MTNYYNLPRPGPTNAVNVPGDLQALAQATEVELDRVADNVPTTTPGGLKARTARSTYTTNGNSATIIDRVSAVVTAGRLYRVGAWNIPTYASDYGRARYEIRTDSGSTLPGTGSPMIAGGQSELPQPWDYAWSVDCVGLYSPTFNGTANFALVLVPQQVDNFVRVAGSTTWYSILFIEDVGIDPGVS